MDVTHVAIKVRDEVYSLPAPNRHYHVIRHMVNELGFSTPIIGVQGFLLENGTFVTRKEAMEIAVANGQYDKWHQLVTGKRKLLYSEDLW